MRPGDDIARSLGGFGPGSRIEHPYEIIGNPAAIRIGANTEILGRARLEALAPPGGTILTFGDGCLVHQDVRFVAVNGIHLGDHVAVAPHSTIIDTIHNYKSTPEGVSWQAPLTVGEPLVIEDGVFVGTSCVITGGVTIGAHSIIAPNSVVTRDVPPGSLVVGNPARITRQRRSDGSWQWVVDPSWMALDPETSSRTDG